MNFSKIKFRWLNSIIRRINNKLIRNNRKSKTWKEDFKNISVWENDIFDEIQKGFSRWKIEEF